MKGYEKILFVAWFGFCFALMTQSLARAGDCSGPGDCGSVPDNNSTAAGVGGALAGGGLAYNSYKKRKRKGAPPSKPDPCAAEQQALSKAQGDLAAAQGQRDHYAQEVNKWAAEDDRLTSRAQQLLSRIRDAISWTPQNTQIGAQLPSGWDKPGGLDNLTSSQWQTLSNLVGRLQGADIQSDVQEFVNDAGSIENTMGELGNAKKNWDTYEDAYLEAQRQVNAAQFALDDCRASHSGDAQSQGDTAPAPS